MQDCEFYTIDGVQKEEKELPFNTIGDNTFIECMNTDRKALKEVGITLCKQKKQV